MLIFIGYKGYFGKYRLLAVKIVHIFRKREGIKENLTIAYERGGRRLVKS